MKKYLSAIVFSTLILGLFGISYSGDPVPFREAVTALRDADMPGEWRAGIYCGILTGAGYEAEVYHDFWVRFKDHDGHWRIVEVGAF